MQKNIIPKDYDVNSECRIAVKNTLNNKFEDLAIIKSEEVYTIPENLFNQEILNYKFKIQVKNDQGIWLDKVNYFYLLDLHKYWNEKVVYSNNDVIHLMNYYSKNERWNNPYVRYCFNNVVKHIENSPMEKMKNLKQYFEIVNNLEELPDFWKNVNVYLKHLIRLRKKIIELRIYNKTYIELQNNNKTNVIFKEFLTKEITELEGYNLSFADFMAGKHYSFLGMREKATNLFSSYLDFDSPLLHEFDIGKGVATYFDINEKEVTKEINDPIVISKNISHSSNTTIIMSVDVQFYRKYGLKIFTNIIALKKYHVHFHIIGDENIVKLLIMQSEKLLQEMKLFYNSTNNITNPTFSSEECPEFVKNQATYFACSRFLHAEFFISLFNSNILILDVDYTILDDLESLIKYIQKLDVAMSIRTPMAGMAPWTRNMAGSVFIKNTQLGKSYVKYVKKYILKGLEYENSWILDQNALCYGMEKVLEYHSDIKINNIPYEIKPFKQTRIRNFLEEKRS